MVRLGGQLLGRRGILGRLRPLQALVADQRNGRSGRAIKVPGSVALNVGGRAAVGSVWCSKAGNCDAGGYNVDGSGHLQGFIVSRT